MRKQIMVIAAAFTVVAGAAVIQNQTMAQTLRDRLVRENGILFDQVQYRLEDKLAELTRGWIDPGAERRRRAEELRSDAQEAERRTGVWALITAVALAALTTLACGSTGAIRQRILAGIAAYCWLLGVLLPVLTISAETDIPHFGRLVLREETKSLMLLLRALWNQQNLLLVGLIGMFGIGVPVLKSICQFLPAQAGRAHRFGAFLARLSLVDVVVIAVIVAFIGSRADAETHVDMRIGLWFFAASGVVSMAASAWSSLSDVGPLRIDERGTSFQT